MLPSRRPGPLVPSIYHFAPASQQAVRSVRAILTWIGPPAGGRIRTPTMSGAWQNLMPLQERDCSGGTA
jgi:hypothetical protein